MIISLLLSNSPINFRKKILLWTIAEGRLATPLASYHNPKVQLIKNPIFIDKGLEVTKRYLSRNGRQFFFFSRILTYVGPLSLTSAQIHTRTKLINVGFPVTKTSDVILGHSSWLHIMWHDQEEWVWCRPYCFCDMGKNSVRFLCFILFLALTNYL